MQRVLTGEILERLEVDVMPLHRDERTVGEERVVVPRGGAFFGLRVAQQRPVASIDEQHLPRAKPSALHDIFRRHGHDAGLRRGGDEPVPGSLPAQRPQPVAVERRTHHHAVAECQCGGTVPGLETNRLIAVEVAHRTGQVAAPLPRIGHKAHERLAHLPPALHEELERVVERRGVRSLGPDCSTQLGLQLCLARTHPGPVPRHGVDLAVVREHAERLGQPPVRHRVRRVPLMKDGEAALACFVLQVEVEVGEARACHQTLVDERATREGGDVHADAV